MAVLFTLVLVVVLVLGASALLLHFFKLAQKRPLLISRLSYINIQSAYQLWLLSFSLMTLAVLALFYPDVLSQYLSAGNLAAPARGVVLFGIAEGESWWTLGWTLSLGITFLTALFMRLQFRPSLADLRRVLPLLPVIALFSSTNALSEEILYRLAVIVPLAQQMDPTWLLLLSAVLFGTPHLRGMPSGLVGALMAGVLGWLLAKSMLESGGFFWAWWIHFLQDIVIFSVIMSNALKTERS